MSRKKTRGETIREVRRDLIEGTPEDSIVARLIKSKDAKDAKEAAKMIKEARASYRASLAPEELAELAFSLVEDARASGDYRAAMTALRQWEKWTGVVRQAKAVHVSAAKTSEERRTVVRDMIAAGSMDVNEGLQMLAAFRDDPAELVDEDPADLDSVSDEDALRIALGLER